MTLSALIRNIKDLHKSNIGSDLYVIDRLELQRDKLLSYIEDLDYSVFDVLGNSERKIKANIKYIYENAIVTGDKDFLEADLDTPLIFSPGMLYDFLEQ